MFKICPFVTKFIINLLAVWGHFQAHFCFMKYILFSRFPASSPVGIVLIQIASQGPEILMSSEQWCLPDHFQDWPTLSRPQTTQCLCKSPRRFHCSEFISVLQTIDWNIRNLLSLNGFSYLSFHIGFVLKIRQTVEWNEQTSSTEQLCNIGPIVGMTDMRSLLPGSFQVQPVIFSRQWIKVLSKREWWEISNKTVEVVRLEWSSSL